MKAAASKRVRHGKGGKNSAHSGLNAQAKYPRHNLERALRIPNAILQQNAGKDCTDTEAAGYVGLSLNGPSRVEISSAIKFGLLERPAPGTLKFSEIARKILRPHNDKEKLDGLREAVLKAPDVSDVYTHYRGENLPDEQFFENALADKFHIPQGNLSEFKVIFLDTLRYASLIEEHDGKFRIIDVLQEDSSRTDGSAPLKKFGKNTNIDSNATCFVVMPFAPPLGNHYSLIFEPAIVKAGLKPVRADDDIFATGKIMDQVWSGINSATILVAELTSRNPNVFYELGLAHALRKPVVLISSNESDVPFDVRHIRVIYYDTSDPFWGPKLLEKVAENILSALKNPEEVIFSSGQL